MGEQASEPLSCPLCATQMSPRKRDPLARITGFVLLYAVCFLFLYLLPVLTLYSGLALGLLAMWSFYTMRTGPTWWCPECWYEMRRRSPPSSVADMP